MCRSDDGKVSALTVLVKAVAILAGLAVLVGFAGKWHPIGDSLAVFRVEFTVTCALATIWSDGSRLIRWGITVLCLGLFTTHVVKSVQWGTSDFDFTLYQQNLLFNRSDDGAGVLEVVRQRLPDFVTFQEVSVTNRPILDALRPDYPSQHLCPLGDALGEAVLSRHPKIEGSGFCSARDGLAGMQVETPFGPVWVVSVHLSWPWPKGQADHVKQVLPYLKTLDGPIVMAGDFNAVAWSYTLRQVQSASGTKRVGPYRASFHLPVIGLPIGIDHVLTTPGYAQTVSRLDKNGSDHHGLWAELSRPSHD